MKKLLIIILSVSFMSLYGETFNVGSIAELQDALSTASSNNESDTIIISSATYNTSSTITFNSDENYSILIRGNGSVIFDGGENTKIMELITTASAGSITVENITFRNGSGDYGGGLYAETQDAEIELTNCTFDNNRAGFVGAGANLYSTTGNITVEDCNFTNNSSPNQSGYPNGTAGGLFIQTEGENPEIKLINSSFENNYAERDGAGAMLYPVGQNSKVTVEKNNFENNEAGEFGAGCWIRCPSDNATVVYKENTMIQNSTTKAGSGGGTYIEIASGTITVENNSFRNNTSIWLGGGLWIEHNGGNLSVKQNVFYNNTSTDNGGGANIFLETGTASIDHNVFNSNQSSAAGGGLNFSTTSGTINIFNNTFYSNTGDDGGDIYLYFDDASSSSNFYNNILYNTGETPISFSGAATVTARFSDIEGGEGEAWFGEGCISEDPLFASPETGDFHLTWANFPSDDNTKSPCIDAGDPSSLKDSDNTRADIGAYYFNQQSGIKSESSNRKIEIIQSKKTITIRYSTENSCSIRIEIYNINGKKLSTLVDRYKNRGKYTTHWNISNASNGIYFCKIAMGNYVITKRILVVK